MVTYGQLKQDVAAMLSKAGLTMERFDVVPGPIHSEGRFYEKQGCTYIYGYFERGKTTVFCQTEDVDELTYRIVQDQVIDHAIEYERKNRVWYGDSRRLWMAKAQEWMHKIDDAYAEKLQEYVAQVLEQAPFDDSRAVTTGAVRFFDDALQAVHMPFLYGLKSTGRELKAIQGQIRRLIISGEYTQTQTIIQVAERVALWLETIDRLQVPVVGLKRDELQTALEKVRTLRE